MCWSISPEAMACDCWWIVAVSYNPTEILRISCPDLKRYATAYAAEDRAFFESAEIGWANRYDRLETLGDRFIGKAYDNDLKYGHKWFYDAAGAIHLIREAGFEKWEERKLHQSALPNIEAVEPAFRRQKAFTSKLTNRFVGSQIACAYRFRHHS